MNTYKKSLIEYWEYCLNEVPKLKTLLESKGVKDIEIQNAEPFNFSKAEKSYFPKLRIKGIVLANPIKGKENEMIGCSSLHTFPLNGTTITIEEFLQKLKKF
jgi:hypothetical protein